MLRLKPGRAEFTVTAQAHLNLEAPQVFEVPGGLYPMRSKTFELSEYRMRGGWPVPVPPCDIYAKSIVSASGDIFADRLLPQDVSTNASIRWIPHPDYYDITATRWRPVADMSPGTYWHSYSSVMPTLIDDYTYRIGSEVFIQRALNFDSDSHSHMWADFGNIIGGSAGYSVIMVLSPNSIYGNNDAVPYNGIWAPGHASPGTDTFAEPLPESYAMVTMTGGAFYYEDEAKERTRALSVDSTSNTPSYVALVFTRPEVAFYVGNGPGSIRVKGLPAGTTDIVSLASSVVLGRTPGDILHTADMALFDICLYASVLTPSEVQTEFSSLAQAYGGA